MHPTTFLLVLLPIVIAVSPQSVSPPSPNFKCHNLTDTCYCGAVLNLLVPFEVDCSNLVEPNEPYLSVKYTYGKKLEIICVTESIWGPDDTKLKELTAGFNQLSLIANNINIQPAEELLIEYCDYSSGDYDELLYSLLAKTHPLTVKLKNNIFQDGVMIPMDTLTNIVLLNLDGSNLVEMPNVTYMQQLQELSLRDNQVQSIPAYSFNNKVNDLLLASNNITHIDPNAFRGLTQLTSLHLWSNHIQELDPHVFDDLTNLDILELMNNKIKSVAPNLFARLHRLRMINLETNQLTTLPEELFWENPNLQSIRLMRNPFTHLPAKIFANATKVAKITLQGNNLTESLADTIFEGLVSLADLTLANNHLTYISKHLFRTTINMSRLVLSHNDISDIDQDAFVYMPLLKELDLSYNQLTTLKLIFVQQTALTDLNLAHNKLHFTSDFTGATAINHLISLEMLDISYNRLEYIPEDFVLLKPSIKKLDMTHNKLEKLDFDMLNTLAKNVEVDVSDNQITIMENMRKVERILQDESLVTKNENVVTLYVANNRLMCDYRNYDLLRYFHNQMDPTFRSVFEIVGKNLYCASPEEFKGAPLNITMLDPSNILEPMDNCTPVCDCYYRLYNNSFIIDCAKRNLTHVPELYMLENVTDAMTTQIILRDNRIQQLPPSSFGNLNVTDLDMSFNNLSEVTWVPDGLLSLRLDHNYLRRINKALLLKLRSLTLDHNPWICDCDTVPFWTYLLLGNNSNSIANWNHIQCNDNNRSIKSLTRESLCPSYANLIIIIVVIGALLIIIPSIAMGLFYKYKQEIKVWLYARNLCLWFVREEDLDKDKIYDAFISFSQHDEHFIVDELLPKLEDVPNPYKLCIHMRNWIPGEFIAKQVADSVLNSRRTIVVLSPSFLESVWGKMEFRAAHTKAISEGVARVIVILFDDLDPNDAKIDEELRVYLKTNTYIKWGDPWFWDKLRYALPHRKCASDGYVNKRFESISVNLDKMDQLNQNVANVNNVNMNNDHQPNINPLLLKGNPLDFGIRCAGIDTPPAEKGIV